MRAMILAAGLGTRLRPLTFVRPKVLTPLGGATVLDFWVSVIAEAGFEAVVVNAFHLVEELARSVRERSWPIPVEVLPERVLLGTGGGLRNALDFFRGETFCAVNGDIVSRLPLRSLAEEHMARGSSASLLLHDCPAFNNVAVNDQGSILGFGREALEMAAADSKVRLLAFTGVHFIQPEILRDIPQGVPWDILAVYRNLIADGRPPKALFCNGLFWREMGSLQGYRELVGELGRLSAGFLPPLVTGEPVRIHPDAVIEPGARLKGTVTAGKGTRVMAGAVVEDSVLWDDVRIEPGSRLRNCIVTDGVTVAGSHTDEVITGGTV